MKKDKHITEVVFRKWKDDGNILALFPYTIDHWNGNCDSYEHIGQHGLADYNGCIHRTIPAKPEEYEDLKNELEQHYGYNLRVIQKVNGKKQRDAIEEFRERYPV